MMKLTRGNASLGIEVEVVFSEPYAVLIAGEDGAEETPAMRVCQRCGVLVVNADDHADFHFAIAARVGDGPPPGFAVKRSSV